MRLLSAFRKNIYDGKSQETSGCGIKAEIWGGIDPIFYNVETGTGRKSLVYGNVVMTEYKMVNLMGPGVFQGKFV